MEYYIYQRYKNENRHSLNKEQGIDRFSPRAKNSVTMKRTTQELSCILLTI